MPMFKKQSADARKRLQHQQYLAREAPEPVFDISSCELTDIPSGTYSLCKVLQKEALMAHNNWLSSFKGGGNLKDLSALRVLDLHQNDISELPPDIDHLQCLQVLNVSNNKLKSLPDALGTMHALQTLNVKGNKLRDIPGSLSTLKSLRSLDISDNHVTSLPSELCKIRTLETLTVDPKHMVHPPADICQQGTQAMMSYLCSECGLKYEPPSKFLLNILDPPKPAHARANNHAAVAELSPVEAAVAKYASFKERRRMDIAFLEKQMNEELTRQESLSRKAAAGKRRLVEYMTKDQERVKGELSVIHNQKESEKKKLIKALYEAEKNARFLVSELLRMNEKARKTEELMEKLERERMESEGWFKVRHEELCNLRRTDVLGAMQDILAQNRAFADVLNAQLNKKERTQKMTLENTSEVDGQLENVLNERAVGQEDLVRHLLKEEKHQKEAFIALQMQKDARHGRVTGQIGLIQQELAQLTSVEREQREHRLETEKDVLESRRTALTDLLIQLLQEKDKREDELKRRLLEMEEQRDAHQTDYWLVQYQRLMDRKPHALIDQEKKLEISVVEILERAGAHDYLHVFSRHRITIETMTQITEEDLIQMGMGELGLRRAVLREVERYKQGLEEERAAAKLKGLDEPEGASKAKSPEPAASPSAPEASPTTPTCPTSPTTLTSPTSPTTPPEDMVARGINSECVICMDSTSATLFLNCGHVCCCGPCGEHLSECPMCRAEILHKIKLAS